MKIYNLNVFAFGTLVATLLVILVSCIKKLEIDIRDDHKKEAIYIIGHVNQEQTYVSIFSLNSIWSEKNQDGSEPISNAQVKIVDPDGNETKGIYNNQIYTFPTLNYKEGSYKIYVTTSDFAVVGEAKMPKAPEQFETRISFIGKSNINLTYSVTDADNDGFDYYLHKFRGSLWIGDRVYTNASYFNDGLFKDPWFVNGCSNPPYHRYLNIIDSMVIIKINQKDRSIVETEFSNLQQANNPFFVPSHVKGNLENDTEGIYGHFYCTVQTSSQAYKIRDLSDTLLSISVMDPNNQPIDFQQFKFIQLRCKVDGELKERVQNHNLDQVSSTLYITYNELVALFMGCDAGGSDLPSYTIWLYMSDGSSKPLRSTSIYIYTPNKHMSIELKVE